MNIKIICAFISGLGALGWSIFIIFLLSTERRVEGVLFLVSVLAILPCTTTLYLIISQKLYSLSESEKIKEQNRVLKMQIEQKKLKQELG